MFDIKDGADFDERLSALEYSLRRLYAHDDNIDFLEKQDLTKNWEVLSQLEKDNMIERYRATLNSALDIKVGYSAIAHNITPNNPRLLTDLLLAGGDPNSTVTFISWGSKEKQTLLSLAISCRNVEAVKILIEHDADPNLKSYYLKAVLNPHGEWRETKLLGPSTPREIACEYHFDDIITLLDNAAKAQLQKTENVVQTQLRLSQSAPPAPVVVDQEREIQINNTYGVM